MWLITSGSCRINRPARDGYTGHASLYRLEPKLEGRRHVVVSAATVMGKSETYIFASNVKGEIRQWGELKGSIKGTLIHATALEGAGYTIQKKIGE